MPAFTAYAAPVLAIDMVEDDDLAGQTVSVTGFEVFEVEGDSVLMFKLADHDGIPHGAWRLEWELDFAAFPN